MIVYRAYIGDVKFTLDKQRGYYYNCTLRMYLHRYVWELNNGEIPKGYDIHHKDGNRHNNEINNLEMVLSTKHQEYHGTINAADQEWIAKQRKHMIENVIPKAAQRTISAEERASRSERSKIAWKNRMPSVYTCSCCGKKYETMALGRNKDNINTFCSNSCKSLWRRKSGIDDIENNCVICGAVFKMNKYRVRETCSKSCASKLIQKRRHGEVGVNR